MMPPVAEHSDAYKQLVVGIDGGGTKTLAWLASCNLAAPPTTIGHGQSGPSNPTATGLEVAQQNIEAAIQQAFADAQLTPAPVNAICIALAGVGREPMRNQIARWARDRHIARHVTVVHDAQAVLAAGTSEGTGVAVICGTGSFAYGELPGGRNARSGGWGYLFGDEGSGYAIGRDALRAVAHAADGRGPSTELTALLLDQMQLNDPAELIPAIYGAPSARNAIAALASCVFRAAEHGDTVAAKICDGAAIDLARLANSIVDQLHLAANQYELALTGGVITRQPVWVETVMEALNNLQSPPCLIHVVSNPVAGAVRLADRAHR